MNLIFIVIFFYKIWLTIEISNGQLISYDVNVFFWISTFIFLLVSNIQI
ncbi:hypothetical protein KL86DYS2_12594 [uncultured Dysgonomonas sp.]|uniref:Uncharacterized protein n=1 Tax=uncultured Dysgonomonas sp. TaxID=206096 RepID=A0A212JY84_9BACT|nr:hypothetical protein KL86DYS2_12594 [uncultured Dysgonomonas sp.]